MSPRIHTCLWFDDQAEQAAEFYTALFPGSRILDVMRYGPGMPMPEGTVLLVEFELGGRMMSALNGGPQYPHTPAISMVVECEDQAEVNRYWQALSAVPQAEQCGWLVDRFGVSWQIVPRQMMAMIKGPDGAPKQRAMAAMMQMKKLDIARLQAAYDGN